tara:strand:- start:1097 stop:1246 length:150 start_codon:yes stop_codon:yes gene_type:complete
MKISESGTFIDLTELINQEENNKKTCYNKIKDIIFKLTSKIYISKHEHD